MLNQLFSLARPLIHALDAETAHLAAVKALSLVPVRARIADDTRLAIAAFGLSFPNPLGLAAGFDKHAEAMEGALGLGFGFVEVGGVTPLPQQGNPRPRVFRLTGDGAVINRYGLNSDGMEAMAARLEARQVMLERKSISQSAGIIGINLGANKDSTDRAADYAVLAKRLAPLADFLTINVSSPNTPGLRDLQAEAALDDLVARTLDACDEAALATGRKTPILVKIAPDLTEAELDGMVAVARRRGIDGMIVSNTTIARPASLADKARSETGGLSGRPLRAMSTRILAQTCLRVDGAFPLIGVGGIDSGEAALEKIEAGASLIQLYTALIYKGPGLVSDIKQHLVDVMQHKNLASLSPLIGRRAKELAAS